jgi:2-iminobutanoate/2-iminopropanoate deaminase
VYPTLAAESDPRGEDEMSKTIVATDQAPGAVGPYSQGVVSDGWVYTAGQVALDPETGELVGSDAASQADRALRNIAAILTAAGSSLDRVVRATVYLVDMDDFAAVNEVYAGYFGEEPPARACVEVSRLPVGARVEIDVIAKTG